MAVYAAGTQDKLQRVCNAISKLVGKPFLLMDFDQANTRAETVPSVEFAATSGLMWRRIRHGSPVGGSVRRAPLHVFVNFRN